MTWAFATLIKLEEQGLAVLALEANLRMSEFNGKKRGKHSH